MVARTFIKRFVALVAVAWSGAAIAEDTQAEGIWLHEHNLARAEFGVAPVQWSADLAQEAQRWAQHLARQNQIVHSNQKERGGAGENLWMGTRDYFAPAQMIASFVEERKDFITGRFPQVSRTGRWADVGHYTQIVWPQTRKVGCAMASGERFDVLVCRYWPAGNRIGDDLAPRAKVAAR